MYIRRFLFVIIVVSFLFTTFYIVPVHAQYACNTDCSLNANGCASGLTCRSSDTTCGKLYNRCGDGSATIPNPARCYGAQTTGGWDMSSPCNTADQCNNAGTTRTFGWGALGACSATCGPGTRPRTCTCGTENNCTVACTSPAGACGAVDNSTTCCVDQLPQGKPVISVTTPNCSLASALQVNWTYGGTTGCGNDWGYSCSGGGNSFTIKVDGVVNTAGISSALRTYTITTSVAATHQIQVCANNGFGENCSANYAVSIDSAAPPVPVPTMTLNADGTCLGRYLVDVSWAAVNDSGCGGLNTTPYWTQASTSPYTTVLNGWTNTWQTPTNQTSTSSYPPGTTVTAHVRSRDQFDQQSAWSSDVAMTIPTPSPYPTIHIAGPFTEDLGGGNCVSGVSLNPNSLSLQMVANPSTGVTTNCTKTATSYACDIVIDNQTGQCISPNTLLTLSGTYAGYSNIGWRAGNVCTGAPVGLTVGIGNVDNNIPVFLTYDGAGIQPTPPGGGGGTGGWFKVSNSGFINRYDGRQNFLPSSMSAYDSDDDVSTKQCFINSASSIVQNTPIDLGPNGTSQAGVPQYSTQNWYTSGYVFNDDVTVAKYIDYVEARRQITTISSLGEINTDGIYVSTTPLIINTADLPIFDGKKVVLIAKNTSITINDNVIPTGGSLALVGSNISIDPAVSEIDAIVVGDTILTGSSTTPLKIKGNLASKNPVGIYRANTNSRKPSLFVVFNPTLFVSLIPYLSTNTYDWKQ